MCNIYMYRSYLEAVWGNISPHSLCVKPACFPHVTCNMVECWLYISDDVRACVPLHNGTPEAWSQLPIPKISPTLLISVFSRSYYFTARFIHMVSALKM